MRGRRSITMKSLALIWVVLSEQFGLLREKPPVKFWCVAESGQSHAAVSVAVLDVQTAPSIEQVVANAIDAAPQFADGNTSP